MAKPSWEAMVVLEALVIRQTTRLVRGWPCACGTMPPASKHERTHDKHREAVLVMLQSRAHSPGAIQHELECDCCWPG